MPHPVNRRRFVQGLLAAKFALTNQAHATPAAAEPGWLLLGTHDGQGTYRARWDGRTGQLGPVELAAATPQPTYLTRHPHLPVVYACNETDGPEAAVSAFTLRAATGTLTPLARQATGGGAPCFASVDRTGRLLFTANYSGSLTAFRLDERGQPAPAASVFRCSATQACGTGGPVKDRQEGPHLHCATLSPDNRFVLACDLGDDSILVFPLRQGAAAPPLGAPTRIAAAPGSGPRHLAFHPNGRWLYCIHELACTVALLHWHEDRPTKADYVAGGLVSVRPAAHPTQPPDTAAEIALTRDGRFAYTSTRSADVLTLFAINASDGRLGQLQQLPCGGQTPRFFALDPTERWLLCAHQGSNTVTVFARDPTAGTLRPAGTYAAPNPECLLWI